MSDPMALYDDYISGVLKQLDAAFERSKENLFSTLAGRGSLASSGQAQELADVIQRRYMDQLGALIPQMQLQGRQEKERIRQFEHGLGEQKRQFSQQMGYNQQQFAQQAAMDAFNRMMREREQALAEMQLAAQLDAARYGAQQQGRNWWQQGLGQLLGTLGGTVLGYPAAALGSYLGGALTGAMFPGYTTHGYGGGMLNLYDRLPIPQQPTGLNIGG